MKHVPIFFLFISVASLYSQTTKNIDDGFGLIKMDQVLKPIENMVTEVKMEEMWKQPLGGEMIAKTYTVNLSKLKVKDFFGLPIVRIEIAFDEENIREFNILMEEPTKKAHAAFMDKVLKNYGPPEVSSLDDNMIECPSWFTSKTLLMVSAEGAIITKNGKNYIYANFLQAYGG